ncbi:uncharacterized protein BO96DRAFT_501688, partial [Aspergillus niger CBS 101883]|uniref:uncharacterized protein n=1 Tax=Aspergillus lacticoffeatus (strain CBS 101883) TaxID=1450533 RepID=UPI000D7F17D2
MASPDLEAATALKVQGNKAFAEHEWPTAIDFYSRAIEKYDKEPSFFSNRAQAHIKLEAYGFAIADASKALELDSNYVKVRWDAAGCCYCCSPLTYPTPLLGLLAPRPCELRYSELQGSPERLQGRDQERA